MSWHNPQVSQVRWLDALNTTDEEIPGHGVVYLNSSGYASEYGVTLPADPYVLEVIKFPAWASTVEYSKEVAGTYGPTCEVQERYHDVMGLFAVNGPAPIPPGRAGVVTIDPPFVALCDLRNLPAGTKRLVPKADSWNLTTPRTSDTNCGDPWTWFEWFRILRDMEPGTTPIKPVFVDIDSLRPNT